MAISAGGIGSGLDIQGLVSQLMALERRPLAALAGKRTEFNGELSAFSAIRGKISTFQDSANALAKPETFSRLKATSSDESFFSATAEEGAALTSYSIEVLALAQADKKYAVGAAAYAGQTGTVELTSGSNTFSIAIDGTNNTLEGIRDAINNSEDNSSITASVITDESDVQQLVLTAKGQGSDNAISLTDLDGTVAGTLNFGSVVGFEQMDARVKIVGFIVSSSSNTITDAIAGVTLNVKDVTTEASSLKVERDTQGIKAEVSKFVALYNGLNQEIEKFSGENGALSGDNVLLTIERGIQSVMNTPVGTASLKYLSEIGITTSESGALVFDSAEFDAATSSNLEGVTALFTAAEDGLAVRLGQRLDAFLNADNGLIKAREDGINSVIKLIQSRQDALERRLESVEQRLRDQFTALDSLISQMTSTGNFLTQQLAALPGA